MADLKELIARLEAATGPDRELDLLISRVGYTHGVVKWEQIYIDTDGDDLPTSAYLTPARHPYGFMTKARPS